MQLLFFMAIGYVEGLDIYYYFDFCIGKFKSRLLDQRFEHFFRLYLCYLFLNSCHA